VSAACGFRVLFDHSSLACVFSLSLLFSFFFFLSLQELYFVFFLVLCLILLHM